MASARGKNYTVLIVDDDPDLLQLLTDGLELLGDFQVVQAVDGIQGLEQYFEVRPDCVIIDVKMPGLDGYQLVRALRGDPDSAETPLIMLTALAQDKDEFVGLAAGADQYLVKPVKLRNLVEAVQSAVEITSEERQQHLLALAEKSDEAFASGLNHTPAS
jgi:DNA-binding response OmpR family regulator